MTTGQLLLAVQQYRQFVDEFGEPEDVGEEEAASLNPHVVWTLRHDEHEELFPGFWPGDDVIGYFQTSNAWSDSNKPPQVPFYLWVACPSCHGMGDEACSQCEGGGLVGIAVHNCLQLETEADILATATP